MHKYKNNTNLCNKQLKRYYLYLLNKLETINFYNNEHMKLLIDNNINIDIDNISLLID